MRTFLLATCTLVISCLFNCAQAAQPIRTVALSGDPVPGTPEGVFFDDFDLPVIDSFGRTVFRATLAGEGVDVSNSQGIWSEGTGNLSLVARSGEQAAGVSGGINYSGFGHPLVDAAGRTAFQADLTGTAVGSSYNDEAIWFGTSESLAMVARIGDEAPGIASGVNFSSLTDLMLSYDGHAAFLAELEGTGVDSTNDSSLWLANAGVPSMIVRTGDPAPGLPSSDVSFGWLGEPSVASGGQLAFEARVTGTGIDTTNTSGIWTRVNGTLDVAVRAGDPADGTPNGVHFEGIGGPAINSAGQTVFNGFLDGPGISGHNSDGVWLEETGIVAQIVRETNQAPGMPDGELFRRFQPARFSLNSLGHVTFHSPTTSSAGIWTGGPDSLTLVTGRGDQAPGTPIGVTFRTFLPFAPALNNNSQIAFLGTVIGSGVDRTNDTGIWAQGPTGSLQLVAREGDMLEVAAGDTRTIDGLVLVGAGPASAGFDQDHRSSSSGFNDSGQLAFWASFTDGTEGIFVSSLVAIPEPGTLLLSVFAVGLILSRRRLR